MNCDLCDHEIQTYTYTIGPGPEKPIFRHIVVTCNGLRNLCVDCARKITVAVMERIIDRAFSR